MEGFKLIKTKFEDKKQIIGVMFNEKDNYNLFITQVKKVYKIQDDMNVNVFSNDFIINEDIFSCFVAQHISTNDFVLDIQLDVLSSTITAATSNSSVSFKQANSNDDVKSQISPVAEQPPAAAPSIPLSGETEYFNFTDLTAVPGQSFSLKQIPSTDEIRSIVSIQSLLNIELLENKHRTEIAKSIVFHILNNNPNEKLLREDFVELSQSIVRIFPSEVKATYYVPFAKGHLAKGKLYDAYNNTRAKLSAAGVIQIRIRHKPENTNVEEINLSEDNENINNCIDILKSGCGEWDLVRDSWKRTHSYRQNELKNKELSTIDYITKYKVLQNEKNVESFYIDFKMLYPESKTIFEWKVYHQKVIGLSKKIKDNSVKEILTYIDKAQDDGTNIRYVFVPYILPTSRKKSKLEVQESFIYYSKNILIADDEIRNSLKRIELERQPKTINPWI